MVYEITHPKEQHFVIFFIACYVVGRQMGPQKVFRSQSPESVNVTLYGQRDLTGMINVITESSEEGGRRWESIEGTGCGKGADAKECTGLWKLKKARKLIHLWKLPKEHLDLIFLFMLFISGRTGSSVLHGLFSNHTEWGLLFGCDAWVSLLQSTGSKLQ